MITKSKMLIVGDNPFQNISHLSQQRAREREIKLNDPKYAAEVIVTGVENGAEGFLFTVSDKNLSILRNIDPQKLTMPLKLYAISPYSFEYVRLAVRLGGMPALAKNVGMKVISSRNATAAALGILGVIRNNPRALFRAFMSYEESRIRATVIGGKLELKSILLHEVVTDMALGLGMDWLFKEHITVTKKFGLTPGFDTRNLPFLVRRFKEWGIDPTGFVIIAPFNSIGFQMSPSREDCENSLKELPNTVVFAFSLLAAGYLKPSQAVEYIKSLPSLNGVVFGVSSTEQAAKTFSTMSAEL